MLKPKDVDPIAKAFEKVSERLGLHPQADPSGTDGRAVLFDALFKPSPTSCNQCGMCCKAFFLPIPGWLLLEAQESWAAGIREKEWKYTDFYGREETFNFTKFSPIIMNWIMNHVTPLTAEERDALDGEMTKNLKEGSQAFRDRFKCGHLDESGDLPQCNIHETDEYPSTCRDYQPRSQRGYLRKGEIPHLQCSYLDHNWTMEQTWAKKMNFVYSKKTVSDFCKGDVIEGVGIEVK